MKLINRDWDKEIELNIDNPKCLVIKDINYFYEFQRELMLTNEEGRFMLNNGIKNLNFETEVAIINDLLSLSLNNKKFLNLLYKDIVKNSMDSLFLDFNNIKKANLVFMNEIKKNYSRMITYEDNVELDDLLKLYNVKFSSNYDSITMLLISYLEILFEISKVKVLFISFLIYLVPKEEIMEIIKYCKRENKYIVFLEKEKPDTFYDKIIETIYIDEDLILEV
ncbi:MAG: type II-A CRISPR-associated protein Csn2 [Erysipelotrichaceae bacterium]|jgi:CRISPR type II-A-associated protein Csn2|nr:type II-A CRISPR-associated protein Csn2 [Erysipelotrichaceae bacterium]